MPQEKAAKSGYILLIEDDRGTCELEAQRLEPLGLELRKAYNAAEAKAALAQGAPVMMLLDYSLPDADALEFIAELKESAAEVPPFLLVTGRGDEAVAVAAMKAGALDYLVKDGFFLERLPAVMLKALSDAGMRARLKESEERLRVFFEYSNVGKSITSPDGKVQPNLELCRMLGYSQEELSALNWREITPAEDIPPTEKIVAELARGVRDNARFEKRYLRKDGGVLWADVNVSVRRDSGGRPLYFLTTILDITERRKLEADLGREEARYRALLESLPDVVMSFDREHRHVYVSPNISGLGIVPSEYIGKNHREAGFPEELCRIFDESLDRVFKTGRQHEIEFEADLPAGRRAFNWRLVPQADAAGGVESVTTFARDITQVRELRADYKHLFDSMQDGFAVHEIIFGPGGEPADYRVLSLNPAFCALTGLEKEAAEGQLVSKIMPDSYREWVEIYGRVVLTGEPARFEKFSEALDRHFSILAFRNKPGQFSTLFTDITENKKAQETLRRQNIVLELAGRAASFGGWVVDLSTNICTWSDQAAAIHEEPAGFSPAVDKGINYYAPEWREKITQVFGACAREGVPYDEEMEIITAKGNRRWVRAIGQAGRGPDGKINQVYGSFQDISAEKKTKAALLEEESRFKVLAENAPEAIFVQAGGRFVYLNPAACALFGAASQAELIGQPFMERMAPEFRESIRERIARQVETGAAVPLMEQQYLRLDGSRVSVETTAVPVQFGGAVSHLVFVRDITLRKKMEEEALKNQKIESLGVLAGGIAHDFNNMLMGVTANLSLLASKNPPNAEIIEEAISAARSAQALAGQLLSFSRGGQPLRKELCLERPLREIYALTVSGSAVKQALVVEEGLWSAEVDENQIKQALGNILINGLQAMPAGGTLGLKAENLEVGPDTTLGLAPGKYLKITVTDTGVGIPEKYLPQVFDPYFTTKPKGHGLGLAMAWTVVKNHGGHIAVSTEQGKGSVFEVYLPASGRRLADCSDKRSGILTGSGRILLLEDEEIVLKAAGRMLRELGYSHEVTGDGRETLRRYEEAQKEGEPFDAVIMDLTIPGGMGGAQAGPELRRRFPEAIIIVSSGYSDEAVMSDHKAFGFDAVLPKPYRYEDIAEVLARLLAKK